MEIDINSTNFKVDASFKPHYWKDIDAGLWEKQSFELIDAIVKESDQVLDIGCWAGPLSLYMAAKGAHVYAVDPDPEAFKALLKNLALNPTLSHRIKPYRLAISRENGNAKLYARTDYGNSSTSLLQRSRDGIDHEAADTLSFEEFIGKTGLQQIDFIKMDIEGGEFQIAHQLLPVLSRFNYPGIYLSLHYAYLNEFLYQENIENKFIALSMMKIERILGIHLFQKKLHAVLQKIILLAKEYRFIYDQNGNQLKGKELNPQYLIKKKVDLFLTNEAWKK